MIETTTQDTVSTGRDAARRFRRLRLAGVVLVAMAGWGWGAWERFVHLPIAENTTRIALALDLVDRFDDTPGHRAYIDLAAEMKPWWDQIEDLQRRIQSAKDDDTRDALIGERDASLVAFVQDHGLAAKVDLLVASFDTFTRCIAVAACDAGVIERAIAVDVKRIWRTFRPWILHRRSDAGGGPHDFGRDLEDLYFRFVG